MRNRLLKYALIVVVHLALVTFGFTQTQVEGLVLQKVNILRDSLNLQPLELDTVLLKAARDQAWYMSHYDKLSHFQKTFTKETPSERVAYYNGNRTYVGENVATVPRINVEGYFLSSEQIADSLFNGWLHSPPHYENMIYPHFTKMALGYLVSKNKQIYAAQVFSSNEIQLPEAFQNSEVSWGVRPSEFTCKNEAKTYETMLFANSLIIEGNSIYFYFHDILFFQNVIKNVNDGLALDIILREQLPCNKENQFHISAVHDGEMKRPIYKNDLYRLNEANNPRKIKVKLGEVPNYLSDKVWEPNIIVINDNKLCDYSFPVEAPSAIYPLAELKPYYDISEDSIAHAILPGDNVVALRDSVDVEVTYKRSEKEFYSVSFIPFNQLLEWGPYINEVRVACYASVEGASWFNQKLLEHRKEAVFKLLNQNDFNMNAVQIETSENWELMNAQIEEEDIDELKEKSHSEIKRYLKNNKTAFFDSLLYEQRKTHIRAFIDTSLNIASYADLLIASYYDSSLTVNFLPWNKILREDYILANQNIEVGLIDSLKGRAELKTNLLGASSIGYTVNSMDSILVQAFIEDVDTSSSKQVFNFAHFLTKYWFSRYSMSYETRGVATSISPEELRTMIAALDTNEISPSDLIRLKVNVLLAGIHYYVAHNTWQHVDAYFQAIATLVRQGDFTPKEATELALFCNYFYKFRIAIDILHPFYEKELLSEDGYFVLAKTATLIRNSMEQSIYRGYMGSVKKSNQARYCEWLNRSFQIQRDEYIKKDFCAVCM